MPIYIHNESNRWNVDTERNGRKIVLKRNKDQNILNLIETLTCNPKENAPQIPN